MHGEKEEKKAKTEEALEPYQPDFILWSDCSVLANGHGASACISSKTCSLSNPYNKGNLWHYPTLCILNHVEDYVIQQRCGGYWARLCPAEHIQNPVENSHALRKDFLLCSIRASQNYPLSGPLWGWKLEKLAKSQQSPIILSHLYLRVNLHQIGPFPKSSW